MGEKFIIKYAYCLNDFLKQKLLSGTKKMNILLQIYKEFDVDVFYGNDSDYYEKLNNWIIN